MSTGERILVVGPDEVRAIAQQVAGIILRELKQAQAPKEPDPYMDPRQIAEAIPALKASTVGRQIREGRYGTKLGAKGRLVARLSEVRKYNKLK